MKNQIRPLLTLFALLAFITGILYPLLVTGISQVFFPFQANGSLVKQNENVIGSELIGQDFTADTYFWSRPSATTGTLYNAYGQTALTGSSGSNLGPLSKVLVETVQNRIVELRKTDPTNLSEIPVDLVTSSASGLDPHISLASAYYQVARVAQARGMDETAIISLIEESTEDRQWGLFGEPRINVLLLNLALDGIQ